MTSGTIVLYLYKGFILKYIAPLNLYNPSPYKFDSVTLQSAGWDNKSIQELLLEMKKRIPAYQESYDQYMSARSTLKTFQKAKDLDNMLANKSDNWEMKKIMAFYESYFDEDSGNTRQQGIEQLENYLNEEVSGHRSICEDLNGKLSEIKELVLAKKAAEEAAEDHQKAVEANQKAVEGSQKPVVEENQNTFLPILPIIPINSFTIFRILLTIFPFFIYFKLIDFNLNYLIFHIEIVIPTIVANLLLFVWEYYRLYSKVRKYYKVGKIIYMFCKKKIYSFYKKIYRKL